MEGIDSLTETWIDDAMDWAPGLTEAQINLAAWTPDRLDFQHGLGTLSVLPPEIRAKVWDLVLPKAEDYFDIQPLKDRNWTVADMGKARVHENLRFAEASKQLYDEVTSQFYHKRSLAIILSSSYSRPPSRPRSDEPRSLAMFGVFVRSCVAVEYIVSASLAKFTSIKIVIELPYVVLDPAYGRSCACAEISNVQFSIDELTENLQQHWLTGVKSESTCPKLDVIIHIRQIHFSDNDGYKRWMIQVPPSLKKIADLLQPFRELHLINGASVETDFHECFGQEWLSELLRQVTEDMQTVGKVRRYEWIGEKPPGGWRQPSMERALEQSYMLLARFEERGGAIPVGEPLAIGPPEVDPDDGIQ
ncbi:MAG: hypothetical protein Q9169_008106 [Polycauliona sp. 2 TL-2023]